jgi:hypothetical protein
MPLIKKKQKVVRVNFSVAMDRDLRDQLRAYAEYTNVELAEIIEEAVRYAIRSDAEFTTAQTNGPVNMEPRVKAVEPKAKQSEKAA